MKKCFQFCNTGKISCEQFVNIKRIDFNLVNVSSQIKEIDIKYITVINQFIVHPIKLMYKKRI